MVRKESPRATARGIVFLTVRCYLFFVRPGCVFFTDRAVACVRFAVALAAVATLFASARAAAEVVSGFLVTLASPFPKRSSGHFDSKYMIARAEKLGNTEPTILP